MFDDSFLVEISLSNQSGVLKATKKEVAAAEYISELERNKLWLHMDDELRLKKPGYLRFQRKSITVSHLLSCLKEGFCVTSLFYRKDPFNWLGSFDCQWQGAQIIFLDADDSEVSMLQTIDNLYYKPTFAMTSQSHLMPGKKNRFRLVYAFDEVIQDWDDYCRVASILMNDVEHTIDKNGHEGFKLDRGCTTSKGRFFLGNPKSNVESWTSWIIYNPLDLSSTYDSDTDSVDVRPLEKVEDGNKRSTRNQRQSNARTTINRPYVYANEEVANLLLKDCRSSKLSIQEIVQKYFKFYNLTLETPLKKVPANISFIPYRKGYIRLFFRPKWITEKTGKKKTRHPPLS